MYNEGHRIKLKTITAVYYLNYGKLYNYYAYIKLNVRKVTIYMSKKYRAKDY